MLYFAPVLPAPVAVTKECFRHIYHQPENAYRRTTLISPSHQLQKTNPSYRSTYRQHYLRTLSNNRRTLSPQSRDNCLRNCFSSPLWVQNQENSAQPGRAIYLNQDPFFVNLGLAETLKIKCGKAPKQTTLSLGGLFTTR